MELVMDSENSAAQFQILDNSRHDNPENRNRRGRPTIGDDLLAWSRNAWRAFFEEFWPDIGGALLSIRNRRASTIRDVRDAFAALRGCPNAAVATAFWSGSPATCDDKTLRRERKRGSEIHLKIRKSYYRHDELLQLHREAELAVDGTSAENNKEIREGIRVEADRRKRSLLEFAEDLARLEDEYRDLDTKVRNLEAYFYSSELLDFLHSPRCSLNPHNLANALAGLPYMKWRQSRTRCSVLPKESYARFPFRIVRVISRIWARRSEEFGKAPIEFFRAEVLKLPKPDLDVKESLCQHWRDLRLAIEECWKTRHPGPLVPYSIASAFMKNLHREKTSIDRILDATEVLEPPLSR